MKLNKTNICVEINSNALLKKAEELLISKHQEIIEPLFDLSDKDSGAKYLVYTEAIDKWWINWHFSALKYQITLADLEIILDNDENEHIVD